MEIHTDICSWWGDYKYDIMCGKAARDEAVPLRYKRIRGEQEVTPDFEITSIRVIEIVERFQPKANQRLASLLRMSMPRSIVASAAAYEIRKWVAVRKRRCRE